MSETSDQQAPKPLPWHHRAPVLTMALNVALILTIFLTRERWVAWQLEHDLPLPEEFSRIWEADVSPDGNVMTVYTSQSITFWDLRSGRQTGRFKTVIQMHSGQKARSPDGRYRVVRAGTMRMHGEFRGIGVRSKGPPT